MIKPETCRMHVEYCEDCEDWEPIPFHNEGGVCLRHRVPVRRQLTPDFLRRAAKIRPRDVEVATGLR
ncbi:MAG: hypothetical protein WBC47_02510 [Dehalococcoidia bacterium]